MAKYKYFTGPIFGISPYIFSSQDDTGVRELVFPGGPGIEVIYDGPVTNVPQNVLDLIGVDQETIDGWAIEADAEIDNPPSDTLFVHNF